MNKRIALLLAILSAPVLAQDETAELRISAQSGVGSRAVFKFFDASEGCPSYNDMPGASAFLGQVRARATDQSRRLPRDKPLHVFLFRPRDAGGISAAGGAAEIRRRSVQVTLHGDSARLIMTGLAKAVPQWQAQGDITMQPATDCKKTSREG